MKTPNVKCLACSKEVYMPNYRIKTFKYCSRMCKDSANIIQIKANCGVCGKQFEHISSRCNKAKYCSRLCYHRSQIDRGTKEFICLHCGSIFLDSPSRKRKYCSKKCRRQPTDNFHYQFVRNKMKKQGKINKCQNCGYNEVPEILGVHHKDRNRENNIDENLIVLCPNCHSLEHHRHIIH